MDATRLYQKSMNSMNYYLLDWIGMAFSLLAVYLLGQKNPWGFVSFIVSNLLWVAVGVLAESTGIIIGNLVFLGLNARGLLKWRREAASTPA